MKQILTICAFLIILLLAIVGCLFIFGVMDLESSLSVMLKFGGAILLLGVCSALVTALMSRTRS